MSISLSVDKNTTHVRQKNKYSTINEALSASLSEVPFEVCCVMFVFLLPRSSESGSVPSARPGKLVRLIDSAVAPCLGAAVASLHAPAASPKYIPETDRPHCDLSLLVADQSVYSTLMQ
jgi:hypothetical protein